MAPAATSWEVTHWAKPMLLNQARGGAKHWRAEAEATREWRHAFMALARHQRIPRLDRIEVDVEHAVLAKTDRSPLPDVGACMPGVKAGIDGLVDAGVIPDDDPAHLVRLTFHAPYRANRHSLTLTITRSTR